MLGSIPFVLAITFDPSINVGSLITAGAVIASVSGAYWALRSNIDNIKELLVMTQHNAEKQDGRIGKLEDAIYSLAANTQRLIGGIEARDKLEWNPANNRRSSERGPG